MYGNNGKVLHIDLSAHSFSVEEPPELFYRTYGGGRGFIAQWLLRYVPKGADPLSEANVLVFATGPTTGLAVSGSARHSVGAKSPLTGGYGDGEAGGFWGHELKSAGWDAVIIKGRSSQPVYIMIENEKVTFHPADRIWGSQIRETEEAIRAEIGDSKVRVAAIGPSGESLSRMACVVHDMRSVAGRAGLGAVMGSKNLKAVAVRGTGHVAVADEQRIKDLSKWVAENIPTVAGWLMGLGTGQHLEAMTQIGNLPVCNYRGGVFEGANRISAEVLKEAGLLTKMVGCYGCTARCKKVVAFDSPYSVSPDYGGPEYETVGAFGSDCGIDDMRAICKASEMCNANGLDTISTGATIAFAMECFERGLLTPDDLGGLSLHWGDSAAMLELLDLIIRREGPGDMLADGARVAATRIGKGSDAFVMDVKGQLIPMHEPRLKSVMGVGYAVSPTGADHSHNVHDTFYENDGWGLDPIKPLGILEPLPSRQLDTAKVRLFTYVHIERHLRNVLDICTFIAWPPQMLVDLVNAATGWNSSLFELMKMSERAINMTRAFNLREGLTAADDRLPQRFFEPHPSGPLSDHGLSPEGFAAALCTYYGMMGWDSSTGVPSAGKLDELNLGWVRQHLESGAE